MPGSHGAMMVPGSEALRRSVPGLQPWERAHGNAGMPPFLRAAVPFMLAAAGALTIVGADLGGARPAAGAAART
eukprot:3377497-Rhodomonas_salina.2